MKDDLLKRGLRKYVDTYLAEGYSKDSIRKVLEKQNYDSKIVNGVLRSRDTYVFLRSSLLLVVLFLSLFFLIWPQIIGNVVVTSEITYTDEINIVRNYSSEYIWLVENAGNIKSIKIDGSVSLAGDAKLYIENGDERVLLFDSGVLQDDFTSSKITGLVVGVDSSDLNINLDYSSDYEEEVTSTEGVIGFEVVDSTFNFDFDHNKLCTRWEVESLDEGSVSTECYASSP